MCDLSLLQSAVLLYPRNDNYNLIGYPFLDEHLQKSRERQYPRSGNARNPTNGHTWIDDSEFSEFGAAPAPSILGLDNTLEHVIRQPRCNSSVPTFSVCRYPQTERIIDNYVRDTVFYIIYSSIRRRRCDVQDNCSSNTTRRKGERKIYGRQQLLRERYWKLCAARRTEFPALSHSRGSCAFPTVAVGRRGNARRLCTATPRNRVYTRISITSWRHRQPTPASHQQPARVRSYGVQQIFIIGKSNLNGFKKRISPSP